MHTAGAGRLTFLYRCFWKVMLVCRRFVIVSLCRNCRSLTSCGKRRVGVHSAGGVLPLEIHGRLLATVVHLGEAMRSTDEAGYRIVLKRLQQDRDGKLREDDVSMGNTDESGNGSE